MESQLQRWIVMALLWCMSSVCMGQSLIVTDQLHQQALGKYSEYLEDRSGQTTLSSVKMDSRWLPGQTDALNFGFTHSSYWMRIPLRTDQIQSRFLLQVEYALLDVAELYVEQDGEVIQHFRAGNAIEIAQRPIKHRTFLFPLELKPNQNYQLYARFAGNVSVQLPLLLWQEKYFWEHDQVQNLLYGLYFGVLSIMAVYNLFMYFSLREKVHLIYVLMVSGVMLFMLAFRGIGYAHLWSQQMWWNERVVSFVIPYATGCFAWFANEFLQGKKMAPKLYRMQTSCMMIAFLLCVASLILQPNMLTPLNSAWVVVMFISTCILSFTLLRKDRAARFFAAAYLMFIFGGIVLALSKFGVIEYSFASENLLQAGSMLEAFLLSVAIAERVRMLQVDKLNAMEAEMAARDEAFKLAEREIRIQMESRAKSEFLASMSHEIRTPMNGVLGLAELLKDTPLNEQQREYLNTLSNSGKALLTVINDILDYSKVDAGKVKLENHEFDLFELIEETLSLFMPQIRVTGIKLFAFVDEPVTRKWIGDSHRLRQILVNLLGNAFKFTEAGAVKVNVRLEEGGAQPLLRIDVVDTGVGLSGEQAARLFQSYSQADNSIARKYGGTGLGLAISKRLVELMGGEIGVSSTLGVGSCFWFTLNLQPVGKPDAMPIMDDSAKHLIVSPDTLVKQNLRQNLVMLGGTVLSFESFKEFHQGAAALGNCIKSVFVQTDEGISDAFMHALEALRPENIFVLGNVQATHSCSLAYVQLPYPVTTMRIRQLFNGQLSSAPERQGVKSAPTPIGLRVLVAEDNKVNQLVIRGLLRQFSIEPVIVDNGLEAVKRFQAAPDDFDLILMDCDMPEMNGYQATEAIRRFEWLERRKPITISALTAHVLEEHRQQAEKAGMNEHLSKPIDKAALERVLRRHARELVAY